MPFDPVNFEERLRLRPTMLFIHGQTTHSRVRDGSTLTTAAVSVLTQLRSEVS